MTSLPGAFAVDNGTILLLVTLIVLPIAAIAFARSGAAWKELGKGDFAIDQELPPRGHSAPSQGADQAVAEEETRQLLEAKAYRHRRRGGEPIDVEATMTQMLESASANTGPDAELRDEVRRLVIASNERRLRRGQEPLDVEAEIERRLAKFA